MFTSAQCLLLELLNLNELRRHPRRLGDIFTTLDNHYLIKLTGTGVGSILTPLVMAGHTGEYDEQQRISAGCFRGFQYSPGL